MTVTIKHKFVSVNGEDPDASLVAENAWNDSHNVTADPGLVGRSPEGGSGPASTITVGSGLVLTGGVLSALGGGGGGGATGPPGPTGPVGPTGPAGGGISSITAGTGLAGGTITTSGTISMPNVGPGGSFTNASITLDAQGRVVAASTGTGGGGLGLEVEADTPFPTSLFALPDGTVLAGDWWNPAALSSMFQDTAGTTPVTAAGQQVGLIKGQTGQGHNLVANGTKPFLRNSGSLWWLEFNGTSDSITGSFSLTSPLTRVTAARQITWVSGARLWEGFINDALIYQAGATPPAIGMLTVAGGQLLDPSNMTVGSDHIVTEVFNGFLSSLAVDHDAPVTNSSVNLISIAGGATIGSRGGSLANFGNLRWYGAIHIQTLLSSAQLAQCQTFFGALAGLSL